MPFSRRNHYISQLYLENFTQDDGFLYHYRTLVSNSYVPAWKRCRPAAVAYQEHLYTSTSRGDESDDFELWLNQQVESPAAESLYKAVNDKRLTGRDYNALIRLLAAHIVKTPAYYMKNLHKWQQEAEAALSGLGERIKRRSDEGGTLGTDDSLSELHSYGVDFPLRVTIKPSQDATKTLISTETVVGRPIWLWTMEHILTNTYKRLLEHRWTILSSEEDLPWFTSDDPVLCLNFRGPSDYDFEGGWNVPNTDIMMPLGPRHLLFTEVGHKAGQKGSLLPRPQAIFLRKALAEHAFRYVFSRSPDTAVSQYRPRIVDQARLEQEAQERLKWHHDQSKAEAELFRPKTI